MAESSPVPPTSTFVIRFWKEWSAAGSRWRGWVEHVQSGQRVGFQDLDRLLTFIRSFEIFQDDPGQNAAQAQRRQSRISDQNINEETVMHKKSKSTQSKENKKGVKNEHV
jgi:hypothetical protein